VNYLREIAFIITLAAVFSTGILTGEEMTHVVGKGETIYSISRLYRISPEELMRANGIADPARLQSGKRLIVPPSAFQGIPAIVPGTSALTVSDYRVVKGDTLYSIARTRGISLETLLEINKFSLNQVIKTGDIIKVPAQESVRTAQNNPAKNDEKPIDTSLRWPVNPREITYMTGQLGVVVQGEPFEPVKSLTQGKVISAGPWRRFGQVAIIEAAGGYVYMYGGCESLSVKVGDKIGPGTEVGKLGINMVSEKPQLFFMVFRSNSPIDPAKAPRAAQGYPSGA
jgi:murein DD-endopeptidase MepM/ murein hydrolase activator NlpD